MSARMGFVLGALILMSAVVAAHQSAPTGRVGDADTLCAKKGEPHELKRISGRDWRVRIGLDPCVSVTDAKKILGAINEKRMVNRQRPFAQGTCAGQPPTVPELRMAQILSIELSNERWLEVVPEGRFTVMTRNAASSLSGLFLLVAIREDDVELYRVSCWIE